MLTNWTSLESNGNETRFFEQVLMRKTVRRDLVDILRTYYGHKLTCDITIVKRVIISSI